MNKIHIEAQADPDRLHELGVASWPMWEKEASSFPWHCDEAEICYLLEGDVTVTPEGGTAVRFGAGDLVHFAAGMTCHWEIHQTVRKYYRFA
ncbi:MAG: cupin domain-containing protein [Thiohalomonadaceae bacterium]